MAVSDITDDGYLRLQRLARSALPPIFNELYSAQPVQVETAVIDTRDADALARVITLLAKTR